MVHVTCLKSVSITYKLQLFSGLHAFSYIFSSKGAVPTYGASFGAGIGLIGLNNLQCSGSESILQDCLSGPVTMCDHSEDAGVQCQLRTSMYY